MSQTLAIAAERKPRELAIDPWLVALSLIGACAAARLAYLIWLCPYELVGDEAYYWVQSQHLDLSYREKGPLFAWLIALCCRAFGNVEWAVRFPVLVGWSFAAWGCGKLALAMTHHRRTALLSVVVFLLIPIFEADAQIATQDGLLVPLLVALTAVGLRLFRRWEAGAQTWPEWIAFWALLGVGMLLKQSVLLFSTAPVCYFAVRHRQLRLRPALFAQQLVGLLVMIAFSAPILIWERRHGWPMLAHTLGHLGIGADHATNPNSGNPATWLGVTVGGIVGAGGPAFIVLSIWASWRAWQRRDGDPARWHDRLWLICAAWPSVLFFVLLSLTKPVVATWPLPSLVPLVVLVGEMACDEFDRVAAFRSRDFARWWSLMVIYGVVAVVFISFPTTLGHLPLIGPKLDKALLTRIHGSRGEALELLDVARSVPTPDWQRPIIVTPHYMKASLYSFYLPRDCGLTVTTSGGYIGKRPNNFDMWDDTRLTNAAFRGRSLLLTQGTPQEWQQLLAADSITPIPGHERLLLATNFQGRRPGVTPPSERLLP